MRPSGVDIIIAGDSVIKRQDPERAAAEFQRTTWGAQIGEDSGLFKVPEIISYDSSLGEIAYKRFKRPARYRDCLARADNPNKLASHVGQALAAIHQGLRFDGTNVPHKVTLHGDFGCGNLFFCETNDELWIIDWQTSHWIGLPYDQRLASAAFDLGTLLISMFYGRIGAAYTIDHLEELANVSLQSYCDSLGQRTTLAPLRDALLAIIGQWMVAVHSQKNPLRRLLYRDSLSRLEKFVAEIE